MSPAEPQTMAIRSKWLRQRTYILAAGLATFLLALIYAAIIEGGLILPATTILLTGWLISSLDFEPLRESLVASEFGLFSKTSRGSHFMARKDIREFMEEYPDQSGSRRAGVALTNGSLVKLAAVESPVVLTDARQAAARELVAELNALLRQVDSAGKLTPLPYKRLVR